MQMAKIPSSFPDLRKYLKAFEWPFIEEMRAKLETSFREIAGQRAFRIEPCKIFSPPGQSQPGVAQLHSGTDEDPGTVPEVYPTARGYLQLLSFRMGESYRRPCSMTGADPGSMKYTDLLVFSNVCPNSVDDLTQPGVWYTLGWLAPNFGRQKRGEGGDTGGGGGVEGLKTAQVFAPSFGSPFPESHGGGLYEALEAACRSGGDGKEQWFVTVLDTLATPARIWRALHAPLELRKDRTGQLAPVGCPIMERLLFKHEDDRRLQTDEDDDFFVDDDEVDDALDSLADEEFLEDDAILRNRVRPGSKETTHQPLGGCVHVAGHCLVQVRMIGSQQARDRTGRESGDMNRSQQARDRTGRECVGVCVPARDTVCCFSWQLILRIPPLR